MRPAHPDGNQRVPSFGGYATIPRSMTEGRASIRVRIHFAPTDTPLYPGDTSLERAWSEYRYWLYSYVLPE